RRQNEQAERPKVGSHASTPLSRKRRTPASDMNLMRVCPSGFGVRACEGSGLCLHGGVARLRRILFPRIEPLLECWSRDRGVGAREAGTASRRTTVRGVGGQSVAFPGVHASGR